MTVEELEVELRRKEKELYLCSRLGLFLTQEVEELVSLRRGMLSDHTRVLLELQVFCFYLLKIFLKNYPMHF